MAEVIKKDVLIVDDIEINRELLAMIFAEKFNTIKATNGQEAIDYLEEGKTPCIILLDLLMPVVDGFGVLAYLREKGFEDKIPVIVLTSETTEDNSNKAFDLGANDVVEKPFNSYVIRRRTENLIDLYEHKNNLKQMVEEQTKQIMIQSARLNEVNCRIIDTLGTIVEFRNLESGTHILRVREFTAILLKAYAHENPGCGFTPDIINMISYASAMHDVGKITIPDSILLKPGRLSEAEFEIMKQHTVMGETIIANMDGLVDNAYLEYCRKIARSHHERYDGKGYPDGLVGDDIPIEAQVVSIADAYDALINERVYKVAYSKQQAYNMIMEGACGVFNPKLLRILEKVKPEFESLVEE